MRVTPSVPWPEALDLHFEREAEQDPDDDDDAEHRHALVCRRDDDRPDDVSDDEHLEAEQDAAAEVATEPLVRSVARRSPGSVAQEGGERSESAEDHDPGADGFDRP